MLPKRGTWLLCRLSGFTSVYLNQIVTSDKCLTENLFSNQYNYDTRRTYGVYHGGRIFYLHACVRACVRAYQYLIIENLFKCEV